MPTVVVVIYRGLIEKVISDQDARVLIFDLYEGDEKPCEWEAEVNPEAVRKFVQGETAP